MNLEFQVCSKCIMDTTDPDITFDDKGICNHCHEFEIKEKVRKAEINNIHWIYDLIRENGKGKKYDCLLGLSGGVDSSLTLHYLVENGIRPLTFSIDNGWNSKSADENMMRLVEGLKVPFHRYMIDTNKFLELQVAFMKSGVANIEIPTDHILMASSYEMAINNDIKYIISGGNLSTEGIMPKAWGYQPKDLYHIKAIYKKFMKKKLEGLPMISLLQYLWYRFVKKIEIINLLDYYEYNREKAKKLLKEKYGWIDYGEKHCESAFTQWFQNYYLYMKFGYDKRKAHYSSLINSGQMTRSEAMKKMLEPPEYPDIIKFDVLKISCKSYKDYPNHEWLWNLLSKIYRITKMRSRVYQVFPEELSFKKE